MPWRRASSTTPTSDWLITAVGPPPCATRILRSVMAGLLRAANGAHSVPDSAAAHHRDSSPPVFTGLTPRRPGGTMQPNVEPETEGVRVQLPLPTRTRLYRPVAAVTPARRYRAADAHRHRAQRFAARRRRRRCARLDRLRGHPARRAVHAELRALALRLGTVQDLPHRRFRRRGGYGVDGVLGRTPPL